MMSPKKQSLFFGTFLLLLSNIYVKGLGFFYRVAMVRLLGTEAMGLIEMVNPIYSFLLVLAGWGLPTAISQNTAEASARQRKGEVSTIFQSGLLLLGVSGLLVTFIGWAASPLIIHYLAPDPRISSCLKTILPAIFIISIASAFRGHFQGLRQVSALGGSQSVEQTVRVISGILLTYHLLSFSLERAVTAAAYGTVLGETAGFLYLLALYNREKKFQSSNGIISPRQAWQLIKFGTPLTASRLVVSVIMILQAFLIPFSLGQAGWEIGEATALYGCFSGVAMSLLNLPGVFTVALAVSVMPAIAESGIGNYSRLQKQTVNSLEATLIFTLPGMAILYLFAPQLCGFIFHSPQAAEPLKILACGGCFLYMQMTLNSILQGLGEVKALFFNSLLSGICLLIGIVLLTPIPSLGIKGAAIAVDISYISGFCLNLLAFNRRSKLVLPWSKILFKPLLAILTAMIIFRFTLPHLSVLLINSKLLLLGEIIIVGLLYFLILLLIGGLDIFKNIIKKIFASSTH